MANTMTDQFLQNNLQYAAGQAVHKAGRPGKQPITPAQHDAAADRPKAADR
jgi:hypothetical protein